MEIRQLRYFVLAARKKSFKIAADELFVSRAALSKSIASLESEVGYALFDRTRDGVVLTPAGRRFLEKAAPVVEGHDELERAVRSERLLTSVNLCIPISWTEAFSPSIARFRAARPDVNVSVSSWLDVECVRRARSGEADVVVSHMPITDMADEGKQLVRAPLYIAMAPTCPLAAKDEVTAHDLASYDIVYYACGCQELAWAPPIGGRTETFDNDMMHVYELVCRGDAVFPTPLLTVPSFCHDVVCRRFRGQFDVAVMTGHVTPAARTSPELWEACSELRDALVLDACDVGRDDMASRGPAARAPSSSAA